MYFSHIHTYIKGRCRIQRERRRRMTLVKYQKVPVGRKNKICAGSKID